MSDKQWYAVTYRGTAEMTVWVPAVSVADARRAAEDGEYDEASPVEFVKGKPYTMKARLSPDFTPEDNA